MLPLLPTLALDSLVLQVVKEVSPVCLVSKEEVVNLLWELEGARRGLDSRRFDLGSPTLAAMSAS